jgi:hypothetical protein
LLLLGGLGGGSVFPYWGYGYGYGYGRGGVGIILIVVLAVNEHSIGTPDFHRIGTPL